MRSAIVGAERWLHHEPPLENWGGVPGPGGPWIKCVRSSQVLLPHTNISAERSDSPGYMKLLAMLEIG